MEDDLKRDERAFIVNAVYFTKILREPLFKRISGLRNTVLHTLHLQQTAGDPRRSLSSRLLFTPPPLLSFSFLPLSRLTLTISSNHRVPVPSTRSTRFKTKNAFRSTISATHHFAILQCQNDGNYVSYFSFSISFQCNFTNHYQDSVLSH